MKENLASGGAGEKRETRSEKCETRGISARRIRRRAGFEDPGASGVHKVGFRALRDRTASPSFPPSALLKAGWDTVGKAAPPRSARLAWPEAGRREKQGIRPTSHSPWPPSQRDGLIRRRDQERAPRLNLKKQRKFSRVLQQNYRTFPPAGPKGTANASAQGTRVKWPTSGWIRRFFQFPNREGHNERPSVSCSFQISPSGNPR